MVEAARILRPKDYRSLELEFEARTKLINKICVDIHSRTIPTYLLNKETGEGQIIYPDCYNRRMDELMKMKLEIAKQVFGRLTNEYR